MTNAHPSHFAADFSRKVRNTLARKGIRIIGAHNAPGPGGDFTNGERVYALDDNGTHRVRSYAEVRALGGE